MATLRKWENLGILPDHLLPARGHRGWRYWTESQVEGLKEWVEETERWPGKGLPFYNPSQAKRDQAIDMMRHPRHETAAKPHNPDDPRARIDPSQRAIVIPQYQPTTKTR